MMRARRQHLQLTGLVYELTLGVEVSVGLIPMIEQLSLGHEGDHLEDLGGVERHLDGSAVHLHGHPEAPIRPQEDTLSESLAVIRDVHTHSVCKRQSDAAQPRHLRNGT